MKKILALLAFSLTSYAAFSQHWQLMPFASYGRSTLIDGYQLKKNLQARPSPEAGIQLRRFVGKHFAVASGIGWEMCDWQLGPLAFSSQINPVTGTLTEPPVNVNYRFHYLSVPLLLQYNYSINKKIYIGVDAGLGLYWLLYWDVKSTDSQFGTYGLHYKRFSGFGLASVNADYRLNPRYAVSVNPYYERTLTSSNTGSPQKFSVAGVRLGLKIGI